VAPGPVCKLWERGKKSLSPSGNLSPTSQSSSLLYGRKSQERKKKMENREILEINTLEDKLINK
jgi:hypothetical protein